MPHNARLRFDTSADRDDRGPSRLRQPRLRGAGWVRETDNQTPRLALPVQHARQYGRCGVCGAWGWIVSEQRTRRGWENVCKACHE